MLSKHLILCCPLLLLPSIFPSIRVFSSELALCIRWPKCQSFSISPSNEYSGLISFRIDWFDLLAVQRILRSLYFRCLKSKLLIFPETPLSYFFFLFWTLSIQGSQFPHEGWNSMLPTVEAWSLNHMTTKGSTPRLPC